MYLRHVGTSDAVEQISRAEGRGGARRVGLRTCINVRSPSAGGYGAAAGGTHSVVEFSSESRSKAIGSRPMPVYVVGVYLVVRRSRRARAHAATTQRLSQRRARCWLTCRRLCSLCRCRARLRHAKLAQRAQAS